jgi:hypothetical protein
MNGLRAITILMVILTLCSGNVSGAKISHNQFEPQTTNLNLKIDFGNETILQFSSVNGTSVLNATQSVVSVQSDWYGDSAFVTSIEGVPNDPDAGLWWQYWVNEELAPVAANKYIPQEGDVIAWKRLPPQDTDAGPTDSDITTLLGLVILPVSAVGVLLFFHYKRKE